MRLTQQAQGHVPQSCPCGVADARDAAPRVRAAADPDAALERLLERDALFTELIANETHALSLTTLTVDGSALADEVANAVAALLRLAS